MGSQNLTWEVTTKQDLGLDLKIADRFDLTVDIFRDRPRRHLQYGAVSYPALPAFSSADTDRPTSFRGNVGSMRSGGIDGNFGYTQRIGKDSIFTLRGNLTYAYNKVLKYDEAANALYYRMTQGYESEQNRGLIALGLFKDEAEIARRPDPVRTGTDARRHPSIRTSTATASSTTTTSTRSATPRPRNSSYGLGLSAQWKGIDFSILFQGTGEVDFIMEGYSTFPFIANDAGDVLSVVADPKNRWISREISGDPATERQERHFPAALVRSPAKTTPNGPHGELRDGRYHLRLKNLEVGYTLPKAFSPQIPGREGTHLLPRL